MPGHFSPAGASRNLFLTGAPSSTAGRLVPVRLSCESLSRRGCPLPGVPLIVVSSPPYPGSFKNMVVVGLPKRRNSRLQAVAKSNPFVASHLWIWRARVTLTFD